MLNKQLNYFQINGNRDSLLGLIPMLDDYLERCPENRGQITMMKIMAYYHGGDFEKGGRYVSSIEDTLFLNSYKKDFYLFLFASKVPQMNGNDPAIFWYPMVNELEDFLVKNRNNREGWVDWIFIQKQVHSNDQIRENIDSLDSKIEIDNEIKEILEGEVDD